MFPAVERPNLYGVAWRTCSAKTLRREDVRWVK